MLFVSGLSYGSVTVDADSDPVDIAELLKEYFRIMSPLGTCVFEPDFLTMVTLEN